MTRFAATMDEIRAVLSSLATTTDFDLIPAQESGYFSSTTLPPIDVSGITDDIDVIYIVPKNQTPELEEVTRRTEVKRKFPFPGSKTISHKGYDFTYAAQNATVQLILGGALSKNRLLESRVTLEDPSHESVRLYRAVAKRLTEGYELIEDILFSPAALELLSSGWLAISRIDLVGREAYNWDVILHLRAEYEAVRRSQTNTLLDAEASMAKLRQMGWIEEDQPADEAFALFRTNVYGQDFSRLSLPEVLVGKSALEHVRFDQGDLTQATLTESDIVEPISKVRLGSPNLCIGPVSLLA